MIVPGYPNAVANIEHFGRAKVFFSNCYSGVGTVAAVAALAATLFRPKMNIHNLL